MKLFEQTHDNPVFRALPCPTVVLDQDLAISAVNTAYLAATARSECELLNRNIFEAFPENPDMSDSDGAAALTRSFERVLGTGRPDNMWVHRYDIPNPAGDRFLTRYWAPVNAPVVEQGEVVGILHRVEDVTPLQADLRRVLEQYRNVLREPTANDQVQRFAESAKAFAEATVDYRTLLDEVMNLRRALTSRATIDQAKGIIMAERRCTPDRAFEILAGLSQDTNVKLADVAAALVYKAQAPQAAA